MSISVIIITIVFTLKCFYCEQHHDLHRSKTNKNKGLIMKSLHLLLTSVLSLSAFSSLASQELDMNGDSNSDILWRNQITGQNWLWTMDGVDVSESKSLNTIPLYWEITGRGDFDGDGKSDILWRNNNSGRNYMYLMDGFTIRTSQELNYLADSDWKVRGVTDLNGDGKDDIVWRHQVTGQTWIYLIDGISITSSKAASTVSDLSWEIVGTGDVNGDGNGDIIWRHNTSGANYIWLMDGMTLLDSYHLNDVPTSWNIVGLGDLDGDGTEDIIWRNGSGTNWAYLMDGGQIATSKQINTIADTQWQIRTVGDLNGDGKADIFWRHQQTGNTYAYLMDGTDILTAGYSSVISLNWQIISESTLSTVVAVIPTDDCANDTSTQCTLGLDTSVSGAIETDGDEDYFAIAVTEDGTLTVSSTSNINVDGTLYEQGNNSPISEDSSSGEGTNFSISYQVSEGDYFVKVSGEKGDYTLSSTFELDTGVDASTYYQDNISTQITQGKCVGCHTSTGPAAGSRLHFLSSSKSGYLTANQQAFIDLLNEDGVSANTILLKTIGSGHGGGQQLAEGSDDYNALMTYLELVEK